jgi:hypothetical protein
VPSAETVLTWATKVANDWRWLAIAWHVVLAGLLLTIVAGRRPTARMLGYLVVAPVVSVSVLAWLSGNPFNGMAFAVLAAALAVGVPRIARTAITLAGSGRLATGGGFAILGWIYPHFISVDSWAAYTYASPFGLLPCPTLIGVIGLTLMFPDLTSTLWASALVLAGLFFGAIGVFRLGVFLDWGLLIAAGTLAAVVAVDVTRRRSVRATPTERRQRMQGDDFISKPLAMLTHAVTISRAPRAVWPWLIQMGAGSRAGWYSYDFLDNGRRPSATRIVPELQHITLGTLFPALPGITEGFTVVAVDPDRSLTLAWMNANGAPQVTWTFVLEEIPPHSTRLLVRVRGAQGYRFHSLPPWLSKAVVRLVHFVMQQQQLLGIAQRVESLGATMPHASQPAGTRVSVTGSSGDARHRRTPAEPGVADRAMAPVVENLSPSAGFVDSRPR